MAWYILFVEDTTRYSEKCCTGICATGAIGISIPRSTRAAMAWESEDKLSPSAACKKITSSGLRRAAVLDICSEV